jgi:hypothetical protein
LAVPALAAALLVANPVTATAVPSEEIPGFTSVDSYAQGQAGTGYLFLVGDEENRLFGAQAVLNGPPVGSQAVAAFFQRGIAAQYTYGIVGGGSAGKNGALPEPPPGEAAAYFPAEPREFTFEGPLSTASGQAADSRFHAIATDTPSSAADAAATDYNAAGQFRFEYSHAASHTELITRGVVAESTSKIFGLEIGPLKIQYLFSHAIGTITAKGEPTGSATTTAYGATVNGTGVEITDHGVVIAGNPAPGDQNAINAALAQAGLASIEMLPSTVGSGDVGDVSINAATSGLRIVYKDPALGAANPQGFSGGGIQFGGAEVRLLGNLSNLSVSDAQQRSNGPERASAARVGSPQVKALPVRTTMVPNRSEARTETLDATLTATQMTPKEASRLEKGYLAFGIALLAIGIFAARAPLVRLRSRR